MKKRVIVVGGGASGLMAAVMAARAGAQVTILEHMDRVGKKILSTGNGKCNLTNLDMKPEYYRCSDPDFPMKVIGQFGTAETLSFFKQLGIVPKIKNGYVYPRSEQAASVLDALRLEMNRCQVKLVTECEPEKLLHPGEFVVRTSKGEFCGDALILAAGSKAAPSTGSDGSGYRLAGQFGHRVVKPLPALVQLRCREPFYKQLAGIRTEAAVGIWADGRLLARDTGELQLTDYGISGIPVFQVSRFASQALDQRKKVRAEICFLPSMEREEALQFLDERKKLLKDRLAEEFFLGLFPKKLSGVLLKLSQIPLTLPVSAWSIGQWETLKELIWAFQTEVSGTNPFANAQVCMGGVDVSQVRPDTMESKLVRGLYFAGELLDVDGICGGYNLQWAWSSGASAGIHAGSHKL